MRNTTGHPNMPLTKNQHYVWQHYLRAWEQPKLWCLRSDGGQPFPTTPRNVGSERFFYEVKQLTSADLAFLEAMISQADSPGLRDVNRGWVRNLQLSFTLKQQLAAREIDAATRQKVEAQLREIEQTIGERYHGSTETRAIPILDELRHGTAEFYADDNSCADFINYMSMQFFRTAKLRNAVRAINLPLTHDPRRTWPIEAFIYATNMGSHLFQHRRQYSIEFLKNRSAVGFITGDQPVINLTAPSAQALRLYYPLKPDLAMILTSGGVPDHPMAEVEEDQVATYNRAIFAKSDTQIYGADPVYLTAIAQIAKDGSA